MRSGGIGKRPAAWLVWAGHNAGADDHRVRSDLPHPTPRIVMWGSPVLPKIYQR
jgi:hypothetical protein